MNKELYEGIGDVIYAWSLQGFPYERLVDELHDYVNEYIVNNYGPPF